jgi:co-chaperonin GroES (HSP10)
MKIKNFKPAMNFILCKVHVDEKTKSGIYLTDGMSDHWMEVLKVGPKVEVIKPGDYVINTMGQGTGMEFEDGTKAVLFQEFGVSATYTPDKSEKQPFYAPTPPPVQTHDQGRNIIDNPGVEKGPWINEMGEA